MGVEGLWSLVEGCNRSVKLEGLSQRRLAVDASIWIYQFMRGMEGRGQGDRTLKNAHILGFFWRICKLLFYNIHPVFVFDGPAPLLKRQTIAARKAKTRQAEENLEETNQLIVDARLKMHARQALKDEGLAHMPPPIVAEEEEDQLVAAMKGDAQAEAEGDPKKTRRKPRQRSKATGNSSSTTTTTGAVRVSQHRERDLFELPPLPDDRLFFHDEEDSLGDSEGEWEQVRATRGGGDEDEDENGGGDEGWPHGELNPVQMDDETLESLPPRMQLEIVSELQAKSRETSWSRLREMVTKAPTALDFSRQQIQNTLRRNNLSKKLDVVRQRVNQEHLAKGVDTRRIVSSSNKEYVLMDRKVNTPPSEAGEEGLSGLSNKETASSESSGDSDYERHEKRRRLRRMGEVRGGTSLVPSGQVDSPGETGEPNPDDESWGDLESGGYLPEPEEIKKTPTPLVVPLVPALKVVNNPATTEGGDDSDFEDIPAYNAGGVASTPRPLSPFSAAPEVSETRASAVSGWILSQMRECLSLTPSQLEDRLIAVVEKKVNLMDTDDSAFDELVQFQTFLEGLLSREREPARPEKVPTPKKKITAEATQNTLIPVREMVVLEEESRGVRQNGSWKGKEKATGDFELPESDTRQKGPPARLPARPAEGLDLDRMTEDEILAHAIALSEKEAAVKGSPHSKKTPPPFLDDNHEELQKVLSESLAAFHSQHSMDGGDGGQGSVNVPRRPVSPEASTSASFSSRDKETNNGRRSPPPAPHYDLRQELDDLDDLHTLQQLAKRDASSVTLEMINDIKVCNPRPF